MMYIQKGLVEMHPPGGGWVDNTVTLKKSGSPHVHKIYKPGGRPQTETEEHRPTMLMKGIETVRPRVTVSIELWMISWCIKEEKEMSLLRAEKTLDLKLSVEGHLIHQSATLPW